MTRLAQSLLLLAAVATLLPWQRCLGDCHASVEPLGTGHGCHGSECPDEPRDESEHEPLEGDGLAPRSPVEALPLAVATVSSSPEPVLPDVLAVEASPPVSPPASSLATVVLLL
jgi:hypothetical protein